MKFLKNTFTFVIPLTAMLLSYLIYAFASNIMKNYEVKIANDYSIIAVTTHPLQKEKMVKLAGINVDKIITLEKNRIIDNIKSDLSTSSVNMLEKKLPFFYKIKLETFPTTTQLKRIKYELEQINIIKKVEIFSKDHNNIYLLLLLLNQISFILFLIIVIFSIIIISKQIRIWFYEHNEKITILKLHGASILYSSASILKYAILSAFISFAIISAIFLYLVNNIGVLLPKDLEGIIEVTLFIDATLIELLILSFGISILTIIGVLLKYKINND